MRRSTQSLSRLILLSCCLGALTSGRAALGHNSAQTAAATKKPLSHKKIPPATAEEMEALEKILASQPSEPAALFNLALDYATIGENTKAIDLLEKMAEAHTGLDPKGGTDRAFKNIASEPRFVALVNRIEKENPPIVRSATAFVVGERDLAPEGIAYDPVGHEFYMSSLSKHKIVCVSSDGSARDFKSSRQDGLGETLGMKVDANRRILWVVSDSFGAKATESPAGLYQYDLTTGALRFKHLLPPGSKGFLNDVALTSAGEAFTTNTGTGEVFRTSPERDGLELFLPANSVGQANGIALSSDDKVLFVAGWIGVARVDFATKTVNLLKKPHDITDAGLDGLYFHDGTLVGIQNPDLHPARVMRYTLNAGLDTIVKAEVLETYNPLFDVPTTGTFVGDSLYFMANTQLDKRRPDGSMPPISELQPIRILKLQL
jgi:sugar lactone lactonase YvrE